MHLSPILLRCLHYLLLLLLIHFATHTCSRTYVCLYVVCGTILFVRLSLCSDFNCGICILLSSNFSSILAAYILLCCCCCCCCISYYLLLLFALFSLQQPMNLKCSAVQSVSHFKFHFSIFPHRILGKFK